MMEAIRDYILSLIAGALVCSVLMGLLAGRHFAEIGKFLCGLFLTVSVLHPLAELDISGLLTRWKLQDTSEGEAIAALGQDLSRNLLAERIKQETEEYILDKAASLDASVAVELTLTDGDIPVPESILLIGSIKPAAQEQLTDILIRDLGIAKENQVWIQQNDGDG